MLVRRRRGPPAALKDPGTLSDRHVVRNVLFITGLGHLYEPKRKDVVVPEKPFPTAALFARVRELLDPAGGKGHHGLV